MSQINVDNIVNKTDNGSPQLLNGGTIASSYAINANGGVNVSGVLTATSFSGDGSGLTNLPTIDSVTAYAIKSVLIFDQYRF